MKEPGGAEILKTFFLQTVRVRAGALGNWRPYRDSKF
jgi:hypothetical protein